MCTFSIHDGGLCHLFPDFECIDCIRDAALSKAISREGMDREMPKDRAISDHELT